MLSGLKGAYNLARETDAYTVNTREDHSRGKGEHAINQPPDSNLT